MDTAHTSQNDLHNTVHWEWLSNHSETCHKTSILAILLLLQGVSERSELTPLSLCCYCACMVDDLYLHICAHAQIASLRTCTSCLIMWLYQSASWRIHYLSCSFVRKGSQEKTPGIASPPSGKDLWATLTPECHPFAFSRPSYVHVSVHNSALPFFLSSSL